jgi:type II secretory pathway pseudopilin PulG
MAVVFTRKKDGRANCYGLTLIELAVVIAMTALLSSLLFPALSTAKEKSRRAVCMSNLRQLYAVLHTYADDYDNNLPSCGDNKGYYTSILLSSSVFSELSERAGNSNIFYCPNIVFGNGGNAVAQTNQYGVVIGYSYLAAQLSGSIKSPDFVPVPVKWPTTSTNELLADANFWIPTGTGGGIFPALMTIAPHTPTGAAMARGTSFAVGLPGTNSATAGAVGGNVVLADGSVQWVSIGAMRINEASTLTAALANW